MNTKRSEGSANPPSDRITPFDETCTVEERIDEIVATGVDVQIEMMDEDCAFMSVGTNTFAIYVDRGKLFIAWRENDEGIPRRADNKA